MILLLVIQKYSDLSDVIRIFDFCPIVTVLHLLTQQTIQDYTPFLLLLRVKINGILDAVIFTYSFILVVPARGD